MELSTLQSVRYSYKPKTPVILTKRPDSIVIKEGKATVSAGDQEKIAALFPNTYGMKEVTFTEGSSGATEKQVVGVILSGGQAPGGHNVIAGLYDALKAASPDNVLLGFKGGPSGLIEDSYIEFTDDYIDSFRNTGGFDIIGSGRTKLETVAQFQKVGEVAKKHGMNAIVIIGGDDSNTNAAILAEYFAANKAGITVVGCPKTIDGDLKNDDIETSFGFDTAAKTYSECVGNIMKDANSAKKYWHFIKLMGRSASHIALEVGLQTHPNVCLVSEEIAEKKLTLSQVADQITDSVVKRAANGENFGVVVIPEGVIEFIPEVKALIAELNDTLAVKGAELEAITDWDAKLEFLSTIISPASYSVLAILPKDIQSQLLMERDPHGNVQVSQIETEKLLSRLVKDKLAKLKEEGKYDGKFSPLHHFFGYEGRCAFPSNFDADYCYSLGYNAFMLVANKCTGYMSTVRNLSKPASEWVAGGMPITKMMNIERRHGEDKPVIRKALVELEGKPFKALQAVRDRWAVETCFINPGPIQYFGPAEVADQPTITLSLEQN